MSSLLSGLLAPTTGFVLDNFFNNLGYYGQKWAFRIAILLGAILFVVGIVELIKGVHSQQGGGSHYGKCIIGFVGGAIMMYGAQQFEKMMGGSDLFSNLLGGSHGGKGGGFITNVLPSLPIANLPIHDWIHLL